MTYDVEPLKGFEPEIGLLLSTMDDSTREWRENLEESPVEAITWQPYPKAYSIGALLLHLIDCEAYWLEQVIAGLPERPKESKLFLSQQTNQYKGEWPTPPAKPIGWYFDLHDKIRARTRKAIKKFDDPEMLIKRRKNSFTLRWILAHVAEHDSYTGGQAVLMHEMWKACANTGLKLGELP